MMNVPPHEEFIISGNYMCVDVAYDFLLVLVTWILIAAWEILALCLAVWIAIKHFRELPTGWTIEDCFRALIQSHLLYFALFAVAACLSLGLLSPSVSNSEDYSGVLQTFSTVQMFVLAPRLILSIRQYSASVVGESDEATAMTSIAFQQRTHISNGNDHDV